MSQAGSTADPGADRGLDISNPPGDAQARQKQQARRIVIATCVALLGIAGVVAFFATRTKAQSADAGLEAVKTFAVSQGHVSAPVSYAQTPPAGGEHAPVWLTCGIYDQPVPNENAVHALEHGAVWVTYRPDLSAAQVQRLRQAMPDTYVVLSPFPGLPAPVVASAWGKQLPLTGPDDPRLVTFIRTYRQAPQSPEPGATCEGGVGEPSGAT